ncbi:hypothetical protein JR334_01875 [Clostridia bacterium]|nr:hypothetical protein JR334_01875 [Clostridia bacterium]
MNDLVNLFLAMALGGCITVLVQKMTSGVEPPKMRKESYKAIKEKLEIAEVVITEQPIAVQEEYLESLNTWQLFSPEVYNNVQWKKGQITDLEKARKEKTA